MSVIARCGHELTEEEGFGVYMAVKDYSRDGTPAVSHMALCDACALLYKSTNKELKTQKEQDEWLGVNKPVRKSMFICIQNGIGDMFVTFSEDCAKEWVGRKKGRHYDTILYVNDVNAIMVNNCEDYTLRNAE